jgi:Patatin-like phospholipase
MARCLQLCEVLEQEYERLHGALPATYPRPPLPNPEQTPDAFQKAHAERLTRIWTQIHELAKRGQWRSALCLSGGGIRSATFGLGVIQGLARKNLLDKFDYLSTVSGGGYIGGWVTAWIHRAGGMQTVAAELVPPETGKRVPSDGLAPSERDTLVSSTTDTTAKAGLASAPPPRPEIEDEPESPARASLDAGPESSARASLDPEPEPVRHLRAYSNYLNPRFGLLTADTWTLIGIYLRNLILNWLVIMPLLIAVLAVPRMVLALGRHSVSSTLRVGVLIAGLALLLFAVAYLGAHRPSLVRRRGQAGGKHPGAGEEIFGRHADQGSFLRWCLVPLTLSGICLTTYWQWLSRASDGHERWLASTVHLESIGPGAAFALVGLVVHVVAWGVYSVTRKSFHIWEGIAVATIGVLGGLLVWITASQVLGALPAIKGWPSFEVCVALPLFLSAFLLTATLFIGFATDWTDDEDREWWARAGAWMLIVSAVWLVFSALVVIGPMLLLELPTILAMLGGVSGLTAVLIGRSARTSANAKGEAASGRRTGWLDLAAQAAAPIAIACILAGLSLITDPLVVLLGEASWGLLGLDWRVPAQPFDHAGIVENSPLGVTVAAGVLSALAGLLMGWVIDINRYSLHGMYRDRLIRAYLGASHAERTPNPFTEFDPKDNVQMGDLRARQRPLHVVNVALNLVKGGRLAWQHRKAESFTVSTLHAGSLRVGYRPSRAEEGSKPYGSPERGISLGTAIAISGAAASPNMGYHSSPAVTFLMTLFNARLGWWLGNPGPHGEHTYHRTHPKFAIGPMVAEAFGLTDDTSAYVYLSDGGHFENLGLYEMVVRRCHYIVVSDAGCDPKYAFEDLGNAIRKIRVDLGVPITMQKIQLYPKPETAIPGALGGRYCAVGTIGYREVDGRGAIDGVLIYLKPAIVGEEPADIRHYSTSSTAFPHEATTDQWFSESQFESYRMLGYHAIQQICGPGWAGRTLGEFHDQVCTHLSDRAISAASRGMTLSASAPGGSGAGLGPRE